MSDEGKHVSWKSKELIAAVQSSSMCLKLFPGKFSYGQTHLLEEENFCPIKFAQIDRPAGIYKAFWENVWS